MLGSVPPVISLLWSFRCRMGRRSFWLCNLLLWSTFFNVVSLLKLGAPQVLLDLFALGWLAALAGVSSQRMRDTGRGPVWFGWLLLPVLGPVLLALWLLFRRGKPGPVDYLETPRFETGQGKTVVNDVTQLNPVEVEQIVVVQSVDQLRVFLRSSPGPVCVGGGRFSMGGQTLSAGCTFLDMRGLNQVLEFSPKQKIIRVQPGIRWCDVQRVIDPANLAIKVMQTYANFTVGGSLSVNSHGRYVGLGPLILSVRSLRLMLVSGEELEASTSHNSELFYAVVGCYGAIGIITEVTLELAENVPLERSAVKMALAEYRCYFDQQVRTDRRAVFHNADLYPPHYRRLLAVTWSQTELVPPPERLQKSRTSFPFHRYFYWAVTETPLGTWRREHIFDRLFYRDRALHWRNFEAGYDVRELEPLKRSLSTYVLQEYFIPVGRMEEFAEGMGQVLRQDRVNMVNVSIRHALPDPGSLLAWAPEEVFCFVLYYKQRVSEAAKREVGAWTRELIEAALELGGRYYLPYQPQATEEQFRRAYPRAGELFAMKARLDPDYRLRNSLWNLYYAASPERAAGAASQRSQDV